MQKLKSCLLVSLSEVPFLEPWACATQCLHVLPTDVCMFYLLLSACFTYCCLHVLPAAVCLFYLLLSNVLPTVTCMFYPLLSACFTCCSLRVLTTAVCMFDPTAVCMFYLLLSACLTCCCLHLLTYCYQAEILPFYWISAFLVHSLNFFSPLSQFSSNIRVSWTETFCVIWWIVFHPDINVIVRQGPKYQHIDTLSSKMKSDF